jgi:hypothetical protein
MLRARLLLVALAAGVCAVRADDAGASSDGSDPSSSLYGYHNNKKLYFKPTESSTFKLVKLGNVNVTFLDKTNLLGYDGQDMAKVAPGPVVLCVRAPHLPAACFRAREEWWYADTRCVAVMAAGAVQRGNSPGDDHALQQCQFQ